MRLLPLGLLMFLAAGPALAAENVQVHNAARWCASTTYTAPLASGVLNFVSNPANGDTIAVNGTTVTFVTGTPSGNQVQIGGSLATTLASALTFLNGSADAQIAKMTYARDGSAGAGGLGQEIIATATAAQGAGGINLTLAATSAVINAVTNSGKLAPAAPFRVNNGAAVGGTCGSPTYTSGSALNNYQLTSPSTPGTTCVSAGSGGPSGTGAGISDGTCTWNYVGPVDYVFLGDAINDAPAWVTGTVYQRQIVKNGSNTYQANLTCNSNVTCECTSTVAPTGAGSPGDGCTWTAAVWTVQYASASATGLSGQVVTNASYPASHLTQVGAPQINLWNDREYSRANGECCNVFGQVPAYFHISVNGTPLNPVSNFSDNDSNSVNIIITAAPGESFADHSEAALMPVLQNYGVTIHRAATDSNGPALSANGGTEGQGEFLVASRLQIKNDNGGAISDQATGVFQNNKWESTNGMWYNSATMSIDELFVSHGSTGLMVKYGATLTNGTIVNPHGTGQVGFATYSFGQLGDPTHVPYLNNVAIFGFQYCAAFGNVAHAWGAQNPPNVGNNGCDAASSTGVGITAVVTVNASTESATTTALPGSGNLYSVPFTTATFVDPKGNWKLATGSSLIGAARQVLHSTSIYFNLAPFPLVDYSAADVFGTARPQSSNYDIGMFEFLSAGPAVSRPLSGFIQ